MPMSMRQIQNSGDNNNNFDYTKKQNESFQNPGCEVDLQYKLWSNKSFHTNDILSFDELDKKKARQELNGDLNEMAN